MTTLTKAFSIRHDIGRVSSERTVVPWVKTVATDTPAERKKSGIFSKTSFPQVDVRLSGQQSRSKSTKGRVTSIGFDMRPQASRINVVT